MSTIRIINADVLDGLKRLDNESINCVVTSPPYWNLRDYNVDGQIGLESTLQEYIEKLVFVFREVRRVLRKDGTLWLNLGDTYAGYHGNKNSEIPTSATNGWTRGTNENKRSSAIRQGFKQKDLLLVPARVAMALQSDGWYLRSECIWSKANSRPERVRDRPTSAHEKLFLLTKSPKYFYVADGSMRRNVWTIPTAKTSHFAAMPSELAERCIKAGCSAKGIVLDPFGGSGTTGVAAQRLSRDSVLIELNPSYVEMAEQRLHSDGAAFCETVREVVAY